VYTEQKKGLPKVGKRIMTEHGGGKVIRQNIMDRVSTVLLPDGREVDVCHHETHDETEEENGS
jgi:hypothetical protein